MTRVFMLIAMLFLAAGWPAFAEPLVVAAGKPGGAYDTRAIDLVERLAQRGLPSVVNNFNGSNEISLAMCGGKADLGIMQRDAMFARFNEGCDLKPIGLFGEEYGMLFFPPQSDYDEISDLTSADTVMVDTIGSGSELFWKTIAKIESGDDGSHDDWASVQVNNDPIELATVNAENNEIQAILLVRKKSSSDVTRLLELGWSLGYLYDKDIDDQQYKAASLYVSKKIDVDFNNTSTRNWSYKVPSFIVITKKVAADKKLFAAVTAAAQ